MAKQEATGHLPREQRDHLEVDGFLGSAVKLQVKTWTQVKRGQKGVLVATANRFQGRELAPHKHRPKIDATTYGIKQ